MKTYIKSILSAILLAFTGILSGFAQINNNYVIERVYQQPGGQSPLTTIQYVDGLGRPLQTVNYGASPTGNDVVQPFSLRNMGFQVRYRYELAPLSNLYVVYGRGGFGFDTSTTASS